MSFAARQTKDCSTTPPVNAVDWGQEDMVSTMSGYPFAADLISLLFPTQGVPLLPLINQPTSGLSHRRLPPRRPQVG